MTETKAALCGAARASDGPGMEQPRTFLDAYGLVPYPFLFWKKAFLKVLHE
jgi:hypothetical protein